MKALIALLNSIDIKHYHEANLQDEGYKAFVDTVNSTKESFGLDII
ncbi:hypothetical protein [Ureibacillus chungkukjangi]|nr:hypothetical protein [Ureibacillus chungkukjangi]